MNVKLKVLRKVLEEAIANIDAVIVIIVIMN